MIYEWAMIYASKVREWFNIVAEFNMKMAEMILDNTERIEKVEKALKEMGK